MARMVLMKIITIALAVYIICLSDFFPPSEGKNHRYRDIVNVLIVVCIDPALSNKVTNPSSLLGFMNITSINNCSQDGTQGRMTEIEVSLNHPSNARNQGKFASQNVTPHFIATGWFICKTDTKEKQTLHQGSPPQVSKMMISITDRSVITGISGLKMLIFPIPNKINATWNCSSVNGRKTTKCYMEVEFQNFTIEDLTDQNRDLCTKKENCDIFVKKEAPNNPCYRDRTNYLTVTIKDMNRTNAENLREGIHITWSIHSPAGSQITKYSACIQVQNPSTEYQEQNCVLEIIWLALFPTICVTLLIIISYQLFKEDSSCNAWKCRSNSDHLQEITEEYGYRNVPMPGEHSSQQEAPVYLNEIQHEGSRRQPSGHVACSRESQLTVPIITYQALDNIRHGSSQQSSRHSHKSACSAIVSSKTGLNRGNNSSENHMELSVILEHGNTPFNYEAEIACATHSSVPQRSKNLSKHGIHLFSNEGVPFITSLPNSSKRQNSDSASTDQYTNVHCEINETSFTQHHPSGEYSNQHEAPVYLNEIRQEGSRRQPSGHVACSRESQLTVPIIMYQGICDPVQPYGNMQQPNSEDTPGHEYENFLDLAACAPVLHHDHSHSTNTK
ncbi:uncharacterized protein LOC121283302 isoform X3 [Carcharodon carcharias]|uniref:uncharacterized protein LOC121283302 isoform X3 n=1 Tax=Carcharodon carcharias TaxID=13397 RepID=UPI001B7D96BC|nr:uncharacterized protein LOC121283302 isoform X3 [Carcharodon carcharias]